MDHQVMDSVTQLKQMLEHSPIADIRRLEVRLEGDRVVLSGVVGSFYHKQLAQELVRKCLGKLEFVNAIGVAYRTSNDEPDWRS